MKWVIELIIAVLRVLLPAIIDREPATAEESARQPELRKRLEDKVRSRWAVALMAAVLAGAVCLPGCHRQKDVIYVPSGEPVRIRERVRNAEVWIMDADGNPYPGVIDIPAGWYALPDPGPND